MDASFVPGLSRVGRNVAVDDRNRHRGWHVDGYGALVLIDLSHRITDGMITLPNLPAPSIGAHLTREAAEEVYGPGVTFTIGMLTMCTNTGTYLDVPFHRYEDGHDLADLVLDHVVNLPTVVLDKVGTTAIELDRAELVGLAGHAVLIRTDHSDLFGTEQYAIDHPHLTRGSAEALLAAGVTCVGIDSLNIDSITDWQRPVHSILLRAGITIVEHLTNLRSLPASGLTFTAVPPKIVGAGTFTVRAFATV